MSLRQPWKYFLVVALVAVAGGARAESAAPLVIDWSKGDIQDTSANCGTFAFTHMKDRHSYSLYVRGKVSGTCSFLAKGLTFRYPTNYGGTLPHTTTLYAFERFGSDVLVSWIPGY